MALGRDKLCSTKYFLSYTLPNKSISPLLRYAGPCLYSLPLPRAEPSVDCKAQTRLRLVIRYTYFLTYFLPTGDLNFLFYFSGLWTTMTLSISQVFVISNPRYISHLILCWFSYAVEHNCIYVLFTSIILVKWRGRWIGECRSFYKQTTSNGN